MINYFEELMSEEYRSYLKYETLMEDEELASMFDIPELSPEEEAVVQLINEILDRFDNETQLDRTTAFKAAICYLTQQDEEEAMNLEKIAATLTVLLEKCVGRRKECGGTRVMKYILYRSFGDLDKDIKKHELVAVETGKNIDDVADA